MKSLFLFLPLLLVAVAVGLLFTSAKARSIAAEAGYRASQVVFGHMARNGLVLGAVSLPNGLIFSLGTTLGSAKTVSALTNANPAAATSTAHGLSAGDVGIVASGWSKLDGRVVRVSGPTTNAFNYEGIDTTSTALYPASSGGGTFTPVTAFTQISQVLDAQTSGGDMQFANYSFLEQDFETQLPTQASPMVLNLTIADDPSLAGYIALKAAAETRAIRVLKALFPNGSSLYYYGYASFNETPSMSKGQVMGVRATFNLLNKPTRYAT